MSRRLPDTLIAAELSELLANHREVRLLDVLPEEFFKAAHLPRAENACVYKMSFVDDVQALVPDKAAPVVVYGSSDASLASQVAAQRLRDVGYSKVADFRGGLQAWTAAGLHLEKGDAPPPEPPPALADGRYPVMIKESTVTWTGRNMGTTHTGTLGIRSGAAIVEDGKLRSASVVLDMAAVRCTDISDRTTAAILDDHLRSEDFFHTDRHPEATFNVTSAHSIPEATPGRPNMDFAGDLTIKGITHPVCFKGTRGMKDGRLLVRACLEIDRTRWGVLYGSGRFFEMLGKHLVDDKVGVEFRLQLARET